jgi:hypothetical protein
MTTGTGTDPPYALIATGLSIFYLILSAWLIGYKTDQLVLVFLFNSPFLSVRRYPSFYPGLFRIHRILDPFRFHEGFPQLPVQYGSYCQYLPG